MFYLVARFLFRRFRSYHFASGNISVCGTTTSWVSKAEVNVARRKQIQKQPLLRLQVEQRSK